MCRSVLLLLLVVVVFSAEMSRLNLCALASIDECDRSCCRSGMGAMPILKFEEYGFIIFQATGGAATGALAWISSA